MRYSKEHKDETRKRIVQKAGERFRAEGIDAVGVASLMQSVGLTVGGFYAHFRSKEDLVAQACDEGFSNTTARFRGFSEGKPKGERLLALIDAYLSKCHRDDQGSGCFAAASGPELARLSLETRAAFTSQLNAWINLIDDTMKADGWKGDARGIASTLAGTLILSRTVDDPTLSEAILESGRKSIRAGLSK